jgi:hypothetical protein
MGLGSLTLAICLLDRFKFMQHPRPSKIAGRETLRQHGDRSDNGHTKERDPDLIALELFAMLSAIHFNHELASSETKQPIPP